MMAVLGFMCALATSVPPVRVLFLGDEGHHQPRARVGDIREPLFARGIALEYTQDIHVLNAAELAKYDALLVYANIDELPKDAERALLDWVTAGHGLVALHCASYCFRNSDAWVDLVGAQFQSHGTGVFRTKLVDPDHPVFRGLLPFESWDETYVHTRHNPDKQLIEVRVDATGGGSREEPWTWTRTHAKGRVFYTAWGHDERTWTNPGFLELLARGIRWAAGDKFLEQPPLPKIELDDVRVPIYAPNGQKVATRMPKPLSPEESLKLAHLPAGFEARIFASEPMIASPLCLAFDEQGRPWVCDSLDYPNERAEDGHGHDSIKILLDDDGDGRADRVQVFADGLSLATSLCCVRGGVIVHQPPQTLFLKDTDGDGRADVREVLFSGWGTSDTHAGPSHLRYGFDNWIWGTVGYAGFDGTVGRHHQRFGQGVYRFRPDGSELEFVASTTNNTWGLGFSETGEVFCSTANHEQINHLALANSVYESVQGFHGRGLAYIADYDRLQMLGDDLRQVDWHGQFTAAADCALYTARLFPKEWWNRVAFVCEPTGHLVHAARLESKGSGFVAHDGGNLLASTDAWTAPIAAEVGPDGAVWVVDWYSYVVQHNPTPAGFETGKGAAYVTPLRDKEHARIWRIAPQGAFTSVPQGALSSVPPGALSSVSKSAPSPLVRRSLAGAKGTDLVSALDDENLFWRIQAQRLLVESNDLTVVPKLVARIESPRLDAIGNDPGSLHALWTLQGLDRITPGIPRENHGSPPLAGYRALLSGLRHPAPSVRTAALALLPHDAELQSTLLDASVFTDPDLSVRKAALVALARMPASARAGEAVQAMIELPENALDRWVPDAAIAAAARHAGGFLAATLAASKSLAHAEEKPNVVVNLLPNADFETSGERADLPLAWRMRTYSGRAEHRFVNEGRLGGRCLRIDSTSGSDTSWFVDVKIEPQTRYELSGWVKTQGVVGAMGALFNVHARPEPTVTRGLHGDQDWTRVSIDFDSLDAGEASLNCLFGGWGQSKGTAWYDDVKLVKLDRESDLAGLSKTQRRVVTTVAADWAHRGDASSLSEVLAALPEASSGMTKYLVDALVEGWPKENVPALEDSARAALLQLARSSEVLLSAGAIELAQRWKLEGDWSAERERACGALRERFLDASSSADDRLASARRWRRLQADDVVLPVLTSRLDALEDPELVSFLFQELGRQPSPLVGALVLGRFGKLTPGARREAIGLFVSRKAWADELAGAIERGHISRGDLRAENWRALALATDPERVEKLQGATALASTHAAEIEKLFPAAQAKGDSAHGRDLYLKTCTICHAFGGQGGDVGPALDGIGKKSKAELLAEILDPNRSVEANYRLWTVSLADGRIVSGRIVNETRTSLELLDAQAKRTSIDRSDIDGLREQSVSVMPEGLLNGFPVQDVADLLEYLSKP